MSAAERFQRDVAHATRFWLRQPKGVREAMEQSIRAAVGVGTLSLFIDPSGITNSDRDRLSAYRVLAQELGYEVGDFVINHSAHTATAPIRPEGQ